ncbi:hypothetical protein [Nonomuraea recticatena]
MVDFDDLAVKIAALLDGVCQGGCGADRASPTRSGNVGIHAYDLGS